MGILITFSLNREPSITKVLKNYPRVILTRVAFSATLIHFDQHISYLRSTRKSTRNVNILDKMTAFINLPKWCLLRDSSFKFQFNWSHLIVRVRGKKTNFKKGAQCSLHERCSILDNKVFRSYPIPRNFFTLF